MALSNTLYCGLSGLDVNQVKLNVVGNNIANVNTVAFKSSRAMFQPQFYVTDSGGSQPEDTTGGTNPSQRGLGAYVGTIERNFAPGSIETTGRATDMAIDGNGFFVVKSDETKYTRDGTFVLNPRNELVTSKGDFVQGYGVDSNFNILTGQLTNVVIPLGSATTAKATTEASIEGNLNANGTVATGASILNSQLLTVLGGGAAPTAATLLTNVASTSAPATALFSAGQTFNLTGQKGNRDLPTATFNVTATSTVGDLMTFYQNALGINTTVAVPPGSPTPGVTLVPDGTDPNSVRLCVTSNLGTDNAIELPSGSFQAVSGGIPFQFDAGKDAAGISSNPTGSGIHTSFIVYDSLGTPLNVGVTATLESVATTGNTWRFYIESPSNNGSSVAVGTGTLTFDTNGHLRDSTGTSISIDRSNTGAITPLNIGLDFSSMTSYTSRTSEMGLSSQDGFAIGHLTSFSVGEDGKITGVFSNGINRTLGQLAMASFPNQQGLVDRGGNMFVEGADSGQAVIGTPGSMGTGRIISGALELSNVDLSEEFINLIIASTGFNAASRVISTSDQLLTALLNTSR